MNLYLILVAVLVVSASAFVTAPKKAFDTSKFVELFVTMVDNRPR